MRRLASAGGPPARCDSCSQLMRICYNHQHSGSAALAVVLFCFARTRAPVHSSSPESIHAHTVLYSFILFNIYSNYSILLLMECL